MSYTNGVGALQQVLNTMTPATAPAAEATKTQNQGGTAAASAGHANYADQTSLSSASGMIAHALQGPDTRSEKVAALQQAIASGTYSVSSSDVAHKMIQSLLE